MATISTSTPGGPAPNGLLGGPTRWRAERKVQAGFLLALACLFAAGIASYLSVQQLRSNGGWVEHTHDVLTRLESLLSLTTDAETAERGYVITGDADYLTSYEIADSGIREMQAALRRLTADNPAQQRRLERLSGVIASRLASMRVVIQTRQAGGFAAAQEQVRDGPGKRIHGQLRELITEIGTVEEGLLRERQHRVERSTKAALLVSAGSSALALLCVAWAGLISRSDLLNRQKMESEREALRARLAEQLGDMRRLHEISSRLIEMNDLQKMLDELLDATVDLQQADFGNIQLCNPDGDSLRIVAQRGFSPAFLEHFRVVTTKDDSACGRAVRTRERVIVEDVEYDAGFAPHLAIARQAGYRAVQSTPIFGHDGRIIGILSTHFRAPHRPSGRDLQLTDLYVRVASELIQHELQSEAVRAARDDADRANQAKGRFLATASHDLRQPMQALALLNGTLRRLVTDPDIADAIAQQQQVMSSMSGLLNALLDISKLESGAVRPQIAACNLAALFSQLSVEFSQPAAQKGLRFEASSCTAAVLSDPTLLGQIVRNLVSNAIRYTREGVVKLHCQRDGDRVRIDVVDTGIGIPEQSLKDIFEEFVQVGVPANTTREGHGLGLSIVQRTARLLNHELKVTSEEGKGSTFSLFAPAAAPDRRRPLPTGSALGVTDTPGRAHVLIVDDDPAVVSATRLLLKVEGYRVTTASSLDEARERARESDDIDLLVTDFHLSDGHRGTDVIATVREMIGRRVRAILVTGDTSSAVNEIAQGDDVQLTGKPIKADEFLALVGSGVGGRTA